MNKSQQILTIVILLAVLGLAVYGVVRLVGGANGRGGTSNADSIVLDTSLTTGTTVTVGTNLTAASAGTAELWTLGGVQYASERVNFTATSSIPVIIPNPLAATSTLDSLVCRVTGGNLGTVTLDLSTTTAAGNYGSSTPALVAGYSLTAGDTPLIVWKNASTTGAGLNPANVLVPNTTQGPSVFQFRPADVLTLRYASSSPSAGYPAASLLTGYCDLQVHN